MVRLRAVNRACRFGVYRPFGRNVVTEFVNVVVYVNAASLANYLRLALFRAGRYGGYHRLDPVMAEFVNCYRFSRKFFAARFTVNHAFVIARLDAGGFGFVLLDRCGGSVITGARVKRNSGKYAGLSVTNVVIFIHIAETVNITCVALRIACGAKPPFGSVVCLFDVHAENLCIVGCRNLTRFGLVNGIRESVRGILRLGIAQKVHFVGRRRAVIIRILTVKSGVVKRDLYHPATLVGSERIRCKFAVKPFADAAVLIVILINRCAVGCRNRIRSVAVFTRIDNVLRANRQIARRLVASGNNPLNRFILEPIYRIRIVTVKLLVRFFRSVLTVSQVGTVLREIHSAVLFAVVLDVGEFRIIILYAAGIEVQAVPCRHISGFSREGVLERCISHFTLRIRTELDDITDIIRLFTRQRFAVFKRIRIAHRVAA